MFDELIFFITLDCRSKKRLRWCYQTLVNEFDAVLIDIEPWLQANDIFQATEYLVDCCQQLRSLTDVKQLQRSKIQYLLWRISREHKMLSLINKLDMDSYL